MALSFATHFNLHQRMPRRNLVDSSLEEELQSSEDRDATDSEGEGEITVRQSRPSLLYYIHYF
jgi:hypothetical protein